MSSLYPIAYVGAGSNLGNRESTIGRSIELLAQLGTVERVSSLYCSAAWQMSAGSPDFLNAVIALRTERDPLRLLESLEAIERALGRTEKGNWQSRPIDLDLLLVGTIVYASERLVLPHPGIRSRSFVLLPLAEIAPNLIDPVSGRLFSSYIQPAMRNEATQIGAASPRYARS